MLKNTVNVQEHPLRDHSLREQYDESRLSFELLAKTVEVILIDKFHETDTQVHSISTRIKGFESLADKIIRKSYSEPFLEVEDFVGVRIICKFLSDMEKVKECIYDVFSVNKAEEHLEEQSFGYMSNHYIAQLNKNTFGSISGKLQKISFEIQVRTIGMDAWANASHYLHYKKENDMPAEFVKEFQAISATYYLLDKQLNQFYKRQLENIERLKKSNLMEEPINIDSIYEYAQKKFPTYHSTQREKFSDLVQDLLNLGLKTIKEVDDRTEKTREKVEKLFEQSKVEPNSGGALKMSIIFSMSEEELSENDKEVLKEAHDRYFI